MSTRYPRIRHYNTTEYNERYLWIRDCVNITLYVRRPHAEIVRPVMHAMDVFRRAVGSQALSLYLDYEGDWYRLDDKGWEFIQEKFQDPHDARIGLSGDSDEFSAYEFLYQGLSPDDIEQGESSLVTFSLPTEYLEEHGPGRVRELALELAAGLPFSSGHAGLSFAMPEYLLNIRNLIRDEIFRYPGMDVPSSYASLNIGNRVKGAYWLTFLGQPVLGELGGVAGLRARLHSPGTTVQEMEGDRAVVTLGAWPEAGDTEQGHTLPAYGELARVLASWLYEFPRRWSGFTWEEMRRWERRFLD
jgi:hypothetical protein